MKTAGVLIADTVRIAGDEQREAREASWRFICSLSSLLIFFLAMTAFASKLYAAEISYTTAFSLERATSNDATVQGACDNIFQNCGLILEDDLFAEVTFTLPQFDPALGTLTSMSLDFSEEFVMGVKVTVKDGPSGSMSYGYAEHGIEGDPSQLRFILNGFDLFDPAGFFGPPIAGRPADFHLYYLFDSCNTPPNPGGFADLSVDSCSAVSSVEDAFVWERLLMTSGSFLSPLLIGTGSLTGSVSQLGVATYVCSLCGDTGFLNPAIVFRGALFQNEGTISITYNYVPLPASAWLLGTAIAGLGGRRLLRRKISS